MQSKRGGRRLAHSFLLLRRTEAPFGRSFAQNSSAGAERVRQGRSRSHFNDIHSDESPSWMPAWHCLGPHGFPLVVVVGFC
jgi:hypothetical protein